nr:spore-associated protein [Streptomyces albus]
MLAGFTTAVAAPAFAAPGVTPQGVCGKSYKTVNSMPVRSLGTVYLTYNSSNGMNCVATIRQKPGRAVSMSVWLEVPDTGSAAQDSGQYTSHAGPAYLRGKGYCVNWGGNIDNRFVQVYNSNCSLREHRVSFTR